MCAAIRSYKRWSGKERTAATKKTNEAIKKGIIPPASDFPCHIKFHKQYVRDELAKEQNQTDGST